MKHHGHNWTRMNYRELNELSLLKLDQGGHCRFGLGSDQAVIPALLQANCGCLFSCVSQFGCLCIYGGIHAGAILHK